MESKLKKNLVRKITTVLVIFSVIGVNFLPTFTPRANAQFSSLINKALVQPVTDIKTLAKSIADGIAMHLAQRMVDEMVKSTIRWANTGFDGSPAYVTNPVQYAASIANGVAGDVIKGTDLGFLCSPFQAQIKISLQKYYVGSSYQPQCTLTQIGVNIDNFYQDFKQGGWNAWIAMSQDGGNPYSAYINAQGVFDDKVASALAAVNQKLDWASGFKSKGDCIAYNPSQSDIDDYVNGGFITEHDTTRKIDPSMPPGACIEHGPDKTPGVIIKDQLDKVLPSGLDKLITVQHVEQLVGAFANGLLTRYVFGPKGLFSKDYGDHFGASNQAPTGPAEQEATCSANRDTAITNETEVTWSVTSSLGTHLSYTWTGEGLESATSSSAKVIYTTPGSKTASATVTANQVDTEGNIIGISAVRTVPCEGNVIVTQFTPLAMSCSVNTARAGRGVPVTWKATVTGGSGAFTKIQWGGDETDIPGTHTSVVPPIFLYNPSSGIPPTQERASVNTAGNTTTLTISYGLGLQSITTITNNGSSTDITLSRPYTDSAHIPGERGANLTLLDNDSSLPVVVNQACTNSVYISD
ncbi:hypothetical protein KW790_01345 [Candidatus Parcubacteria bacterium]|nr:hypothetical protein [Candidatus Parcubacteria bacterium]